MQKLRPEGLVNLLITFAQGVGVRNAERLVADGYPGRQLRVAIREAQRPGNERYAWGFHMVLRQGSVAMGEDPQRWYTNLNAGRWSAEDDRLLDALRSRIRRGRRRARSS